MVGKGQRSQFWGSHTARVRDATEEGEMQPQPCRSTASPEPLHPHAMAHTKKFSHFNLEKAQQKHRCLQPYCLGNVYGK